jgi:hypothetical protein
MKTLLVALLALLVAASVGTFAQDKPAPEPTLDQTLNWLKDFLPSATGAKVTQKADEMTYVATAGLQVNNGCNVTLTDDEVWAYREGKRSPMSGHYTHQFSFSEMDSSKVGAAYDAEYDPPLLQVWMWTRGGLHTVVNLKDANPLSEIRNAYTQTGIFLDQASAERVVKAFRHAAELCGNNQPF